MKVIRMLCVVSITTVAAFAAAASPASALTRSGAEEWSIYWASRDFGGGAWAIRYCTGPYENVKGKTQWACHGFDMNGGCREWQINVDPYGSQTYHRGLYCETLKSAGANEAGSGPSS
jgi:hypothetical protein